MATKVERKAVEVLLDELDTLQAWLDDTAYPRQSRQSLNEAVAGVKVAFAPKKPPTDEEIQSRIDDNFFDVEYVFQ